MGRIGAFAAADAVAVLVFVAVGSRNHDSGGGLAGVLRIGLPFWIALAAAWAVPLVRRDPLSGSALFLVLPATVVGGLALRNLVFGDGTAPAFVIVTASVLGGALAGWRALARRRLAQA